MTNVIKAHLHSCLEKSLSTLDNGLCLSARAFKFQTDLVTISYRKRKRNVVTIETNFEIIDRIVIAVRVSFLTARNNMAMLFDYPKISVIQTYLGFN